MTTTTIPKNYAILFSAGQTVSDDHEYDSEYWYDLFTTYKQLYENGFDHNSIYALYGDGTDFTTSVSIFQVPAGWGISNITDYPNTASNLQAVFSNLAGIMTSNDNLYVWWLGHGDIDVNCPNVKFRIENRGTYVYDHQLAEYINQITNYNKRDISMVTCHSGGIIDDLSNNSTIIHASVSCEATSFGMEIEEYPHAPLSFYLASALNWETPSGTPVNADFKNDGLVDMEEAFVYADGHDTVNEPVGSDPGFLDDNYFTFCAGEIVRNVNIYDDFVFTGNVTINSGKTLAIATGKNIKFENSSSLIVNGSLNATGTGTNKVTFDFISPNSTTQNGIKVYTGATLNVSNTIIKRAWYGIYCNNTYSSPINNWEIMSCNTGIYFSSTNVGISNNYIHNNWMGIALYNSSPTLTLNKLTGNSNYAVSSSGSTSIPKFGVNWSQGKNKITGNSVGVCAFSNSLPMLGNNSPLDGGYNTLDDNTNYNIYAITNGLIFAVNNYWGYPTPRKTWISNGVIITSPYLSYDPTGLSKAVPTAEDAVLALLTKAMNLIEQKNFAAAREICLDIVNNYSDSYAAFNALSLLTQTFDLNEKETTKLNYKTLFNKDKKKLNAVAGLILAELDKENKLKAIEEVISKFKDDTILEDALFAKFLYYYNDIQDKVNARLVSVELDKLFPNSVSSIDAHHHLGDKDYLQKSYSFSKSEQEQTQNIVSSPIPEEYSLFSNYPNPFNPATVIRYALPFASNVNITVYNTLGQIVKEYYEGTKEAGYYSVNFNGENLSSGVYLYSINAVSVDGKQNFSAVKKMLLIK